MTTNINNLNVFTFIKDIYQSLKHIDLCFSNFNTVIGTRLTKIEDNQQVILDKISGLELLLSKIGETSKTNIMLDKNIEYELLEKMKIMNNLNTSYGNDKVDLKPDELTFSNIIENGYSFLDMNTSLSRNNLEQKENNDNMFLDNCDTNTSTSTSTNIVKKESLDNLLF